MAFDPKRYAAFRAAFVRARRNYNIAAQHPDSHPAPIPVRIPVRGHWGKTDQQGLTKVHVTRHAETVRPAPRIPAHLSIEYLKWRSVWEADAEAQRLCQKGFNCYGDARIHYISKKTGILFSEVKYILRK